MIGTTAALLIGSAISAGTQLYGAKKASDASKDAAAIQTRSADEAIRLHRDQFERSQANLQPWMHTGQGAMVRLNELSGGPAPARPGVPEASAAYAPRPSSSPAPPRMAVSPTGAALPMPRSSSPGQMVPLGQAGAPQAPPTAGGMVMMRSPDGRHTRPIPQQHVEAAKAKGATVVEG